MPNCFQLTKKGEPAAMPLNRIDDLICEHFGKVPDKHIYLYGWYDVIGFAIAMGKPLGSQELRDYVADMPMFPEMLLCILGFLEENFTSDGWYERKY